LIFPHRSDLFDFLVERAYLKRGTEEGEWESQLRAVIAWRCRIQLSDLALAAGEVEEAYEHAYAAVQSLSSEAPSRLRLACLAMQTGRMAEGAAQYGECLKREPLLTEAWPEQFRALVAAGRAEEAEAFLQDCSRLIRAIPLLEEAGPVFPDPFP
jgi:tetratricopeptide (TPR) repeat protein